VPDVRRAGRRNAGLPRKPMPGPDAPRQSLPAPARQSATGHPSKSVSRRCPETSWEQATRRNSAPLRKQCVSKRADSRGSPTKVAYPKGHLLGQHGITHDWLLYTWSPGPRSLASSDGPNRSGVTTTRHDSAARH
jgi:hypothetical protein